MVKLFYLFCERTFLRIIVNNTNTNINLGVCGSNLLCNFFAGKCIAVGEGFNFLSFLSFNEIKRNIDIFYKGYDCNTMHPICAGGCPQVKFISKIHFHFFELF